MKAADANGQHLSPTTYHTEGLSQHLQSQTENAKEQVLNYQANNIIIEDFRLMLHSSFTYLGNWILPHTSFIIYRK